MWRDSGGVGGDVDYALSFQDTQGCLAIWYVSIVSLNQILRFNSHHSILQ